MSHVRGCDAASMLDDGCTERCEERDLIPGRDMQRRGGAEKTLRRVEVPQEAAGHADDCPESNVRVRLYVITNTWCVMRVVSFRLLRYAAMSTKYVQQQTLAVPRVRPRSPPSASSAR